MGWTVASCWGPLEFWASFRNRNMVSGIIQNAVQLGPSCTPLSNCGHEIRNFLDVEQKNLLTNTNWSDCWSQGDPLPQSTEAIHASKGQVWVCQPMIGNCKLYTMSKTSHTHSQQCNWRHAFVLVVFCPLLSIISVKNHLFDVQKWHQNYGSCILRMPQPNSYYMTPTSYDPSMWRSQPTPVLTNQMAFMGTIASSLGWHDQVPLAGDYMWLLIAHSCESQQRKDQWRLYKNMKKYIQDGFSTTKKGGLGSLQTSKRHKDCRKRRVVYREYCRKITPL